MKQYCVYILTNKKYGTLYIGVTSDLVGRVWQHQTKATKGFSEQYNLDTLVYYEIHEEPTAAILREKQIKKWKREWKIRLIEEANPGWNDLSEQVA